MHELLNQMPLPPGACWVPFTVSHLDLMDDDLAEDTAMRVIDQSCRGPACTLWVDSEPLCSVGMIDCRNHDGQVWAVIDKNRRHYHPLLLTRAVRRAIDIAAISMGLKSTHMFVECQRMDAVRWALALGFAEIGRLTIYEHPERDHLIFSRSL